MTDAEKSMALLKRLVANIDGISLTGELHSIVSDAKALLAPPDPVCQRYYCPIAGHRYGCTRKPDHAGSCVFGLSREDINCLMATSAAPKQEAKPGRWQVNKWHLTTGEIAGGEVQFKASNPGIAAEIVARMNADVMTPEVAAVVETAKEWLSVDYHDHVLGWEEHALANAVRALEKSEAAK